MFLTDLLWNPGGMIIPPRTMRMCIHTSEFKEREANQCGPAWLASASRLHYGVYKLQLDNSCLSASLLPTVLSVVTRALDASTDFVGND